VFHNIFLPDLLYITKNLLLLRLHFISILLAFKLSSITSKKYQLPIIKEYS